MKRINIIGTSGSGKSTFSEKLAQVIEAPYIEMDGLYWKANWQEPSDDEFFAKLSHALEVDSWVLDGNYNRTRPVKWQNVDTIIWIDYSFTRTLLQMLRRVLYRITSRHEIWPNTGNIETFRKSFLSRDSVILWMLKNYHSNQKRYQAVMQDPQYSHIEFVRLTSPKQAHAYLEQVRASKETITS